MDPSLLTKLSIGGSAGGTALGLFGNAFKGLASSSMYKYQAGISRMKEEIDRQNANFAFAAGEKEAGIAGLRGRFQMGKIITGQAAHNIDVGKGSALAVQEGQRTISQMDQATIRDNAARKAYGYDVAAAGDEAQARSYDMASKFSLAQIPFDMGSTLLTGSTSVADKWLQAKQYGVPGYNGSGNNGIDYYYYG